MGIVADEEEGERIYLHLLWEMAGSGLVKGRGGRNIGFENDWIGELW